jgi:hypothetical protein
MPTAFGTGLPVPAQPTTWTRNLEWLASARVRLGYTPTPNALLYVTGGGAWGGFNHNASFVNPLAGSNNWMNPFSKTDSGYVVGGGAELMVAAHWTVRAEFFFYHLSGTSNLANIPSSRHSRSCSFGTRPILTSFVSVGTINGRFLAHDFADQSYGGPLSVQPLCTEGIYGAVLFDEAQVLVGKLAERELGRAVRVEELIKERAAMIIGKPGPISTVELQQAATNQFGQRFTGYVGVAERFAGRFESLGASLVNPLMM